MAEILHFMFSQNTNTDTGALQKSEVIAEETRGSKWSTTFLLQLLVFLKMNDLKLRLWSTLRSSPHKKALLKDNVNITALKSNVEQTKPAIFSYHVFTLQTKVFFIRRTRNFSWMLFGFFSRVAVAYSIISTAAPLLGFSENQHCLLMHYPQPRQCRTVATLKQDFKLLDFVKNRVFNRVLVFKFGRKDRIFSVSTNAEH